MVSLLIGPTSDGKFQTLVDLVGDARSNPRAFAINGRKIATYKNGGFENLRRFQKISSLNAFKKFAYMQSLHKHILYAYQL